MPVTKKTERAVFGLICFNEGEHAIRNFMSSLSSLMLLSVFFWFAAFLVTEKTHTWVGAVIGFGIMSGLLFGLAMGWVGAIRHFYPAFRQVFFNKDVCNFMHYVEALITTLMLITTMALLYVLPLANAQQLTATLHAIFAAPPLDKQPVAPKTVPPKAAP